MIANITFCLAAVPTANFVKDSDLHGSPMACTASGEGQQGAVLVLNDARKSWMWNSGSLTGCRCNEETGRTGEGVLTKESLFALPLLVVPKSGFKVFDMLLFDEIQSVFSSRIIEL